jgi:hypothetical protein
LYYVQISVAAVQVVTRFKTLTVHPGTTIMTNDPSTLDLTITSEVARRADRPMCSTTTIHHTNSRNITAAKVNIIITAS